ncbi:hypothetical protein SPAN111604_07380 [Sphingomonas antarctica]|uniref:hypothetical protein n=1 Tax=Sphingomonas antarctica TaxID=2040274 RepID=UPI0039E89D6F
MKPLLIVLAAALTSPALAQDHPVIVSIGSVTSEKTCTTYQLAWGREAMVSSGRSVGVAAGDYAVGASRSATAYAAAWGTDLVKDCVANFPRLRASMRDALASSGKVRVGTGGLVLNASLSATGEAGMAIERDGISDNRQDALVNVRWSLNDRAGRTVAGGLLTKRVSLSSDLSTDNGSFSQSEQSGSAYGRLQSDAALAVARAISFHYAPLRVTDVDDRRVRLNYGTPFLTQGATVLIPNRRGMGTIKAYIETAADGYALAEVDGSGTMDDVAIGTTVQFVEADDPAANKNRHERVDLPL